MDPRKCRTCGYIFPSETERNKHELAASCEPERADRTVRGMFECPDCHYRFGSQKDLDDHTDESVGGCPERDEEES